MGCNTKEMCNMSERSHSSCFVCKVGRRRCNIYWGHGHWVNSLALSTEYVLRTGAFDHTGKQYSSAEEMKQVALERYKKMKGNAPERLVSGSYDFTIFLREPSISKHPKTRMTGQQRIKIKTVRGSRSRPYSATSKRSYSATPRVSHKRSSTMIDIDHQKTIVK
ncbi:notchless protein homolog [Eucalyptus grandis]|uniref:notchless protein homolog n=1 Tax=Eucalyptus grandis TaxID=71139 RepID=UPI00192E8D5E|nr:notchless protein homolog [Eucalyptus grandis]